MNELIAQLLRASQHRFIGRLARDPEMRYFESGSCVCNCRMLINKPGAKKDDGQEPDGFKLELWNQQAQAFADAAHKGDLVDISGRVKTETWTDRTTGEERRALTVMVDRFEVIPRQGQGQPAPATRASAPASAAQQTWASGSASDGDDSEIPF
jgi:single-strand DNA-binding protein